MNTIRNLLKKKSIIIVITLIAILGGYFGYQNMKSIGTTPEYITEKVTKSTLINYVNGTGQVSSATQIDIKPKVSGEIIQVYVKNNQEVKAGDALIQLDSSDASKTVRDAKLSLDSAKISLEKLTAPTDELSLLQAQNSLTNAKDTLEKLKLSQQTDYQNTQDDLTQTKEDSFNKISDAFLDLPTIITALDGVLHDYKFSTNQNVSYILNMFNTENRSEIEIFINNAESDYNTARAKYNKNFTDYKNTSRYSDDIEIESLLSETLETTKSIAQTAKSLSNMLDYFVDYMKRKNWEIPTEIKTYQTNVGTYIGQINTHLSNLLSQQNTLKNAKNSLTEMDQNNPLDLASAEQSVKEKEAALSDLQNGTGSLDLRMQEISVQQKENSLSDAEEKLANYTVRAPFAGIIANLTATKNDVASSGSSIATLLTKQQIAEISLNEVDIAKIQVGQKATLTFDAIEELSITGDVVEVDTIGTASQGVVSYNAKIAFDTQDSRVKSGMSVSADIITESKTDVLLIPMAAVKSQDDGTSYVEIIDGTTIKQQTVEVGESNDTSTEIISGIKEGDLVVTQTITASTNTSTSSTKQQSIFSSFGSGGGPNGTPR
ncbi:efflux RND transporter periplasmic adaptor subunit [Candidatus Gracilibacteria bacterium]|nr:efflux RND transporter periplasmic adaptor subunit [Candidatus Gracilibacteria bacterium]